VDVPYRSGERSPATSTIELTSLAGAQPDSTRSTPAISQHDEFLLEQIARSVKSVIAKNRRSKK